MVVHVYLDNQILRKFRQYGGILVKAANDDILSAQRAYAGEGILAQPASATALAGLIKLVNQGRLETGTSVVTVVSGSGLKYPPVLERHDLKPVSTDIAGWAPRPARVASIRP